MGTSYATGREFSFYWDHPHAYGDKFTPFFICFTALGSSPRVWGQEDKRCKDRRCRRIIPTRMGTSQIAEFVNAVGKDHPHAYGDKFGYFSKSRSATGSSPRVWGQACKSHYQSLQCQDHPHAYGDKRPHMITTRLIVGSSPRVWGQVCQHSVNSRQKEDHPHAYGDKH